MLRKSHGPGQAAGVFDRFETMHLTGVDLSDADAAEAEFERVDFRDCRLCHIDLRRARLLQCTFDGADLTGADLRGASLIHCDLSGATLRDVALDGTYLGFCRLPPALTCRSAGRGNQVDPLSLAASHPVPDWLIESSTDREGLTLLHQALSAGERARTSIFLSYSSADGPVAEQLRLGLLAAGIPTWFAPTDLRQDLHRDVGFYSATDELKRNLHRFLDTAETYLLLLTRHAVASEWVRFEAEAALSRHQSTGSVMRQRLVLALEGDLEPIPPWVTALGPILVPVDPLAATTWAGAIRQILETGQTGPSRAS